MRAAMMPWTVSGISTRRGRSAAVEPCSVRRSTPVSIQDCSTSSTKKGLPSARCTIACLTRAGSPPVSPSSISSVSSRDSGSSHSRERFRLPSVHGWARPVSSGRAVATSSSGPLASRAVTASNSRSGFSRPVDVLDHDDGRVVLGQLLEQRDPGVRELRLRLPGRERALRREPQQWPQAVAPFKAPGDGLGRVVGVEAECGAHDLAERPVGVHPAERPAAAHEPAPTRRQLVVEGADEARLADAGIADERDEVRERRADHPLVGDVEELELALAADERAAELSQRWPSLLAGADERCACSSNAPRTAPAIRSPIRISPGSAWRASRPARLTAPPVTVGPPLGVPVDQDLAGLGADAQRERVAEQPRQPFADGQRRDQRAPRMILEPGRCAEAGHERVGQHRVHAPARRIDLVGGGGRQQLHRCAQPLGLTLHRCVPLHVDHEDRGLLALLDRRQVAVGRRRGREIKRRVGGQDRVLEALERRAGLEPQLGGQRWRLCR